MVMSITVYQAEETRAARSQEVRLPSDILTNMLCDVEPVTSSL